MKKTITWIFILSCLGALLFLGLPLLLQVDCVYSWFSAYLSALRDTEYKGIYITTLGALFGAFLGVIGAVWAQNLSNEQSKSAEIEKTTQIIVSDLKYSLDRVSTIKSAQGFPESRTVLTRAVTQANGDVLQDFEQLLIDNRIVMLPDWRQMVLSLEQKLSSEEMRLLLVSYTELSELSSLVNSKNTGKNWLLDAYTVLTSLCEKSTSLQQVMDNLSTISRKRKS